MKKMSFGQIVGLFVGFLFTIMLITVVVVKSSSAQNSERIVLKKHSVPSQTQPDTPAAQPQAAALILAQKQAQESAQQVIKQQDALLQSQRVQQELSKKIDEMSQAIIQLNERVALLETKKPHEFRPAKKTAFQHVTERRYALPASSGYKAMATVGDRAWIAADSNEDSVTAGQPLPAKPALRVKAVESESGIVVTTHDPR